MLKVPTKTSNRKPLMLSLSLDEMAVVELLAHKRGLTKTALLRQAIRLYQSVDQRLENGERLYVEDPKKQEKMELVLL